MGAGEQAQVAAGEPQESARPLFGVRGPGIERACGDTGARAVSTGNTGNTRNAYSPAAVAAGPHGV